MQNLYLYLTVAREIIVRMPRTNKNDARMCARPAMEVFPFVTNWQHALAAGDNRSFRYEFHQGDDGSSELSVPDRTDCQRTMTEGQKLFVVACSGRFNGPRLPATLHRAARPRPGGLPGPLRNGLSYLSRLDCLGCPNCRLPISMGSFLAKAIAQVSAAGETPTSRLASSRLSRRASPCVSRRGGSCRG